MFQTHPFHLLNKCDFQVVMSRSFSFFPAASSLTSNFTTEVQEICATSYSTSDSVGCEHLGDYTLGKGTAWQEPRPSRLTQTYSLVNNGMLGWMLRCMPCATLAP